MVFMIVWCTNASTEAGVIHSALRARLKVASPEDEVTVIVTLVDQQNLRQFRSGDKKLRRSKINRALRDKADQTQKPLRQFLNKKKARNIVPFWIFNGISVTLQADQIDELARRPEVQSLQLDRILSLPPPSPTLPGSPEWNLNAINAPALWAKGYTGAGVVVANMDTGVDNQHPDLAPRWRGGTNSWFDPHGEHAAPYDNHGHGTQTMGVMIGGDAGGASIGVAPDASWIAVKLFDDAGFTTTTIIHQGFQWLLDPDGNSDTNDLPDVVNGSWGFDQLVNQCYSEFQFDIQALKDAEVAVVFSAGNSGSSSSTSMSPANYTQSFAVGSIDETLLIADHSSRGPSACDNTLFPNIVSPGMSVWTTDLTSGGIIPDSYISVSGTSIAAPHVAGAMALLLSVDPQLTVAELEASLIQSATDLGDPDADNDYGNGLLNVTAAYDLFDTFSLNVNVLGKGGSIVSDPFGIHCLGDCEGEYVDQRKVILTAVTTSSGKFTGWSGDCSGIDISCQVTMDQVKNVSANFYSFPWNLFMPSITKRNLR